jgi:cell division septum initiation protein DivIVA
LGVVVKDENRDISQKLEWLKDKLKSLQKEVSKIEKEMREAEKYEERQ